MEEFIKLINESSQQALALYILCLRNARLQISKPSNPFATKLLDTITVNCSNIEECLTQATLVFAQRENIDAFDRVLLDRHLDKALAQRDFYVM